MKLNPLNIIFVFCVWLTVILLTGSVLHFVNIEWYMSFVPMGFYCFCCVVPVFLFTFVVATLQELGKSATQRELDRIAADRKKRIAEMSRWIS